MEGQGAAGIITVSWYIDQTALKLIICDDGKGVKNPANIFVPFYSTKKMVRALALCSAVRLLRFMRDAYL